MRWLMGALVLMCAAGSWSGGDSSGDDAVMAAVEDLAGRLHIPAEQIVVLSQTEVDWPDSSMGCPRKDMNYAQVITNGSELILEVGGQHYAYHSGRGRPYFYCANPAKKSGAPIGTPRSDI